jgi:serine/threonine protein kinase
MIDKEIIVLRVLNEFNSYPKLIDSYSDSNFSFIIMTLLGPNLDVLKKRKGYLPVKTVLMITIQLIEALQQLHSKGFIHRDLKPDNLVIGVQ